MKEKIKKLPLRWKLTVSVMMLVVLLLIGVSVTVTYYSTRKYTELQDRFNETAMREVSYDLNTVWHKIDELYLTLNSQQVFSEGTIRDSSVFELISSEMQFEKLVNNIVNANNLQNTIIGTLFFLDGDTHYYVGVNPIKKDFVFTETEWYQEFLKGNGKKILYGPVVEDFKSESTQRNTCIYYIAPYGNGLNPEGERPFLLFTLKLSSLLEPIEMFTKEGRQIICADKNSTLLYHPDIEEADAKQILEMMITGPIGPKTLQSGSIYITADFQDDFDWWIVFLDNRAEVYSALRAMNRNILLIVGFFVAAGIILGFFTIRKVMMPLTTLNNYIDIMENAPDTLIQVDSDTETGKIGLRLNEMKQRIKDMDAQIYSLELQERQAQVSALQAQINPHFIYNVLDNIYCMAQLKQTEPILSLSENLSWMMRYSMSMKQIRVPLRAELEHIERYVSILNVRFGNKIVLINRIDKKLNNYAILKLSVQPVIENAWQHGLLPKDRAGKIILSANLVNSDLEIVVENDGNDIDPQAFDRLNQELENVYYSKGSYQGSHGVALTNINNRLKLTFGPSYGIRLSAREGGGCIVSVKMKTELFE